MSNNESFEEKFSNINNTADTTQEYDPQDIEKNKFMAILSYLGILVIVPILAAKESKFARFHANQGLILCIAAILYWIAYSILSSIILSISWHLYWLVSIISIVGIIFLGTSIYRTFQNAESLEVNEEFKHKTICIEN